MNFSTINKILIIRLSSLGDILLTTPLIRSLKKQYPKLQIDFLVKEQYKDLLVLNPYLSNVIIYRSSKEELDNLKNILKSNDYDAVIDLHNNFRSLDIRKTLRVKSYIFRKRSLKKFLLVKFKVNLLKDAPQISVRYADSINIKLDEEGLDLFTNKASAINETNEKYICFAPGSRHFTKMWPEEYYIQLGKMLTNAGYKIVLVGGTSDAAICKHINDDIIGSINLGGKDDILQIAADIKKCKLVVCNDSGLMHIASAVKIPVVVMFGSTVKEFGFTPFRVRNLILENKLLSCRPCSHVGRANCPEGHFKCMLDITPQLAFAEIMKFID
ncbi:MAG TPA: glycosyltransferase family 9 protein [Ignavibacteriaceae bacterium]|nr:glycosyltransferase family 9 protein [Ignavibacteriaceae bacterium]